MDELELLQRLQAIRDEADEHGRDKIRKMIDRLIIDRWGANSVETEDD